MINPTLTIPTTNSNASEWLQWHKTLLTAFSQDESNSIWLAYWAKRGNGHDNSTLRDYMKTQGVDMDSSILANVTDFYKETFSTVSGAILSPFKAMSTIIGVGKWAALGFVVIILGSVGLLVFNIAKNPIATLKATDGIRSDAKKAAIKSQTGGAL